MASKRKQLAARVNAILVEGAEKEMFFSHLKLQKLIFLSYVIYLKRHGEILDYIDFEAWTYGPVVPEVYHYYKALGYKGQDEIREKMINDEAYPVLKNDTTIKETLERYGNVDASALVNLVHQRDGAWHKAFSKGYNKKIPHKNIKEEFVDG